MRLGWLAAAAACHCTAAAVQCLLRQSGSMAGQPLRAPRRARIMLALTFKCWAATARVNRARGARGPLTLRGADDEGRGLKGSRNEQPKSYPMYGTNYGWVPTDRPNLRLGSRKGTHCPKWEVCFSMFDSR